MFHDIGCLHHRILVGLGPSNKLIANLADETLETSVMLVCDISIIFTSQRCSNRHSLFDESLEIILLVLSPWSFPNCLQVRLDESLTPLVSIFEAEILEPTRGEMSFTFLKINLLNS
jgi:hypothetical protein